MSYWDSPPPPVRVVRNNPQYQGQMTEAQLRQYGVPQTPDELTTALRMIQQDIGRRASTGAVRKPGQGSNNPYGSWQYRNGSADDRRVPTTRTQVGKTKTGRTGYLGERPSLMDDYTREEVEYLRGLANNRIAEYEQQRQVNEVDAERERIPIRRDIDTQRDFLPLAQQGVSRETDELLAALNQVIPGTERTFQQGSQSILDAYNSGAENLSGQIAGQSSLAQQLEQLTGQAGSGAGLEAEIENTAEFVRNLLTSSGATGAGALQSSGDAELAAIRNSLGGYNDEADRVNQNIGLQVAAELQGLNQDLAMVTPDFLPFNYGDLMLRTNQGIRDAIRAGEDRESAEQAQRQEAKNRPRYTGLEGARQYAQRAGRPELLGELQDMISTAEQEGTGPGGIAALIDAFGNPDAQVQAAIDAGRPEDEIRALAEDLGLDYEEDYAMSGGGGLMFENPLTDFGLGIPGISIRPGGTGRRPVRVARPNRQTAIDQDLLRDLRSILEGNFSSYEGP